VRDLTIDSFRERFFEVKPFRMTCVLCVGNPVLYWDVRNGSREIRVKLSIENSERKRAYRYFFGAPFVSTSLETTL